MPAAGEIRLVGKQLRTVRSLMAGRSRSRHLRLDYRKIGSLSGLVRGQKRVRRHLQIMPLH